MKTIIAGGRDFDDLDLLRQTCETRDITEVVSGTARGADKLGEHYANCKHIPIQKFYPDWEKDGKAAGYKRNEEMAKYADALIAFWDGKSKGTGHMIDLAEKHGLTITVINY